MSRQLITTSQVAQPTNPFSLGVKANGFLFTSGQVGKNQDGQIIAGFKPQVEQALENLKAIVEAGGSSLSRVVKITIFVTDISKMPQLNEVYKRYFPDDYPARATVEVSGLGLGAEVEIEAIALTE
jgi:2-iminobutanoate/2-iminopropanoate deaminase